MEHIQVGRPILMAALAATSLIAVALVVAGCVLVYLGAVGNSELKLFGNTLSTASVGVVGIFCGAIIGILNVRQSLTALVALGALRDRGSPKIKITRS